ncbi:MAG TPA: hypothetical protein DDW52_21925, partial [Planctomycetaceae bacterium]|nr:hypothetical protein [Planctomycetaceae bacterium]
MSPKQEHELESEDTQKQQDVESEEKVVKEAREHLEKSDLLELAYTDAQALGVAGEEELVMLLYLTGVSRNLSDPLAVIVRGSSS